MKQFMHILHGVQRKIYVDSQVEEANVECRENVK